MVRRFALLVVALLALSAPARGDSPSGGAGIDPAVAPFITSGTVLVARVDPARVDLAAAEAWRAKVFQLLARPGEAGRYAADAARVMPAAKDWLAAFARAGGKSVYAVAFLGDPASAPGVVVVPLGEGADAKAIAGLLVSGKPDGDNAVAGTGYAGTGGAAAGPGGGGRVAATVGRAVVFGTPGQVEKMRGATPADRPNFAAAFAAAGDAPAVVAFSPTFALKMLAGQAMPDTLPPELGDVPSHKLVNGLSWAALGLGAPPAESVHLTLKCKDAVGASAYAQVVDAALKTLRAEPNARAAMPDVDKAADALKPVTAGDTLTLDLDAKTLDDVLLPTLGKGLASARRQAQVSASLMNLNQLTVALMLYRTEHDNQFPDDLSAVAPYVGGPEALKKLLVDPSDPTRDPGYQYLKPSAAAAGDARNASTIVLYGTAAAGTDRVHVGLMNGRVVTMTREALDQKLKAQSGGQPTTRP